MSRTPDGSFEAALRGMLEERRPAVNGASAELHERVARIPDEAGPRAGGGSSRLVARFAGGLAGLAAAAAIALLVIGALASRPGVPEVGSAPAPDAPVATFDLAIEGPGIVRPSTEYSPPPDDLVLMPWAVAAVGSVFLGAVALTGGRLRRLAALAGVLIMAVGANGLSSHPGFEHGSGWGPGTGLDVQVVAPAALGGVDVWYVTAEPGGSVVFALNVRNPGPLPIRLLGVVQDDFTISGLPSWTAVWLHENQDGGLPAAEAATPFRPVEVPPDGHVALYVVGRAGACAFGPSFRLEDASDHASVISRQIRVAYAVVGLSSVGEVELPVALAQPLSEVCTGV
ncbi:MAG: hypothetical protein M3395_04755 [Chloroflexota bacterium]|nr:hypothetical protein [Chloroflexota bacterium]